MSKGKVRMTKNAPVGSRIRPWADLDLQNAKQIQKLDQILGEVLDQIIGEVLGQIHIFFKTWLANNWYEVTYSRSWNEFTFILVLYKMMLELKGEITKENTFASD